MQELDGAEVDTFHVVTLGRAQFRPVVCLPTELHVLLPRDYPFRPPSLSFVSRIYHSMVNPQGGVRLDVLGTQYSPALHFVKILVILGAGDSLTMDLRTLPAVSLAAEAALEELGVAPCPACAGCRCQARPVFLDEDM